MTIAPDMNRTELLAVKDLRVDFFIRKRAVHIVKDLSLRIKADETVVVLGESGSGKSVTSLAIMGLLGSSGAKITAGQMYFEGVDLLTLPPNERRKYRGKKIAMIFQDALSALNPVQKVGKQIQEVIQEHSELSRGDAYQRVLELMDRVRIPNPAQRYHDFPHQFSGGMRQRIMVARSLAMDPVLLIADEPTTALDVTVQAQIMQLLVDLQREHHMGLMLITHDLNVAAEVADQIVVMYAGRVVESSPADALYQAPAHPYTEGLLASTPTAQDKGRMLKSIPGTPPSPANTPSGCAFNPRCPRAREICRVEEPPLVSVPGGRTSACHFWEEVLLDVTK